ncbi:hypothetical protein J6590_048215 [Homalodisca vitripennis]|nr:hypothetical protein J6590_048215 [Homalodisca vitripennis]
MFTSPVQHIVDVSVDYGNAIIDEVYVNVDIYLEVIIKQMGLKCTSTVQHKQRTKYGTLRNTTLNTQPVACYVTYPYTLPSVRQIRPQTWIFSYSYIILPTTRRYRIYSNYRQSQLSNLVWSGIHQRLQTNIDKVSAPLKRQTEQQWLSVSHASPSRSPLCLKPSVAG